MRWRCRLFSMLTILLIALVAFTACGRGEPGYDGYAAAETPEPYEISPEQTSEQTSEQAPAQEPAPVLGATETPAPVETPTPAETPTPEEHRFVYESGVLDTKFSVIQPRRFNLVSHNRARRDEALLHIEWGSIGDMSFEIWQGVTHPSEWGRVFGDELQMGERHETWMLYWRHPEEPTEVFVTENELTVVKYMNEHVRYEWIEEQARNVVTVIFMFRRDGRDYREFSETQVFYMIILDAHTSLHQRHYADARAVVESFVFLDEVATIDLEPSETARRLGITAYNYPRVDGSTSVISLIRVLPETMFEPQDDYPWWMWRGYNHIRNLSRTIPAYELLIGNYVDLIFVPEPSAHVLAFAETAGVELEFTPIAMEALVFITTINNPVDKITTEQILQIYTEMGITNWAELGGYDGPITPHSRNLHSGSHTLMDNLVLQGREIHPDLRRYAIGGMTTMLDEVERFHPDGLWYGLGMHEPEPNTFALGYTVSSFLNRQEPILKALAIDGVYPSRETILSGEYPLVTNYFAVIRADSPDDSPERRIANWLATPEGQDVVESAGLIGLNP